MGHSVKSATGRFLSEQDRKKLKQERKLRHRRKQQKRLLAFLGVIAANVLLMYMIQYNHIHPIFGAGFAAAVSAWMGYHVHA